jgi:hypothetical protein
LEEGVEKTKGLKNLKIKRDELFTVLINPYRNRDPAEKEPGPGSIKP